MKNIHLIPTDKPSRLVKIKDNLFYTTTKNIPGGVYQNIYITSDEKITEGDYWYDYLLETVNKGNLVGIQRSKKIILTTDPKLFNDGVQFIDDEFLEWFVKNPSREEVVIYKLVHKNHFGFDKHKINYKIITPKEEIPKLGTKEFNDLASAYFGGKPEQHIEFINNSIDEFDESLESFKEKQKKILIEMMRDDKESGLYANSKTIIMKDKEKIALLQKCFEDTIWMAIRYANGRGTYAPGMVRDAVRDFKKVFPDWEPKEDITIKPPTDDDLKGIFSRQHYLDDLFKK